MPVRFSRDSLHEVLGVGLQHGVQKRLKVYRVCSGCLKGSIFIGVRGLNNWKRVSGYVLVSLLQYTHNKGPPRDSSNTVNPKPYSTLNLNPLTLNPKLHYYLRLRCQLFRSACRSPSVLAPALQVASAASENSQDMQSRFRAYTL